jgi:UPF0271 protein
MGEGIGNDAALMPYVTSANIACGYHAGDEATMHQTVQLAKSHGVLVGAHPSFPDRENFGRKEMDLSGDEVYNLVKAQITKLKVIALAHEVPLCHVKPHGALYNMAAKEAAIASAIAKAVKDVDANLVLFGLSGSCLIREGEALGLQTKSEVFADRTYQDDGSLTPRTQKGALIEDEAGAIQQVLHIVNGGCVTTITGKVISINAQTICLHGDGHNAVALAKAIHKALLVTGK